MSNLAGTTKKKSLRDILNIASFIAMMLGIEAEDVEDTEDVEDELPTEDMAKSAFQVFKDLSGQWRWFGWVSNKWVDREGEILVDAAHKDFVEWLDRHPERAPELWLYHARGTAHKNRADWWDYKNGFLMFSGILTDEEAKRYKGNREPLGMSHGFWVYKRIGRYITKYRTFEVTVLPLNRAANIHTGFSILEEMKMEKFNPHQREFLVGKLGEELVSKLETNTEEQARLLEEAGVDQKALADEYNALVQSEQDATVKPMIKAVADGVVKELKLEETFALITERLNALTSLQKELEALKAEVKGLKELDDAKLASAFSPLAPLDWGLSVQKSDAAAAPDVEEIVAEKQYSWLEELK